MMPPLQSHQLARITSPEGDVVTEGTPDGYREQFAVVWMRSGWTGPARRTYMKREKAESLAQLLISPVPSQPLDEPPQPMWDKSDPSTLEWLRIDARLVGPWHKGDLLPLETEPSGPGMGLVVRRGVDRGQASA